MSFDNIVHFPTHLSFKRKSIIVKITYSVRERESMNHETLWQILTIFTVVFWILSRFFAFYHRLHAATQNGKHQSNFVTFIALSSSPTECKPKIQIAFAFDRRVRIHFDERKEVYTFQNRQKPTSKQDDNCNSFLCGNFFNESNENHFVAFIKQATIPYLDIDCVCVGWSSVYLVVDCCDAIFSLSFSLELAIGAVAEPPPV